MSIGILPNVNSVKLNRDAKQETKCLFPHSQVEEQPSKKAEKELAKRKKRRQECCVVSRKTASRQNFRKE